MSNGFIRDGSGQPGARYGRDPVTQRAYKADGTVRKERVTRTPEQALAAIGEMEARAHGKMGRQVLSAIASFAGFIASFATFRKWVREAKAYASPEAVAARRAALERQLANLDAKSAAARAFLADGADAIADANGAFSKVGAAYMAFGKANKRAPTAEETEELLAGLIDADTVSLVTGAADPSNDPFAAFRRDAPEATEDTEDEDADNL